MLNLFYRPQRSSRHPKLYITDKKKRSNQKSKRKQTLVTKCHELAQLTGASVFLKIVCQDSNKSYVYATDDLYYEYSSRGLTKTGQVTKENREFGEDPPVNFNENNPVLLSPMKLKKAPKCILPGDLSNITVYYDVADSFADVVCDEETPNIEELQPTMKPTTELEDSEPNQLPQEPSHPDPLEVPDNCDLESPTKELSEEEENYQPTSPLRVDFETPGLSLQSCWSSTYTHQQSVWFGKTLSLKWWPKQDLLVLSSFPGRRKGQQDQETVGYLFWTVLLFNACHLPPEKPSPA